jgi:hypothetical protein
VLIYFAVTQIKLLRTAGTKHFKNMFLKIKKRCDADGGRDANNPQLSAVFARVIARTGKQ